MALNRKPSESENTKRTSHKLSVPHSTEKTVFGHNVQVRGMNSRSSNKSSSSRFIPFDAEDRDTIGWKTPRLTIP